MPEAIERLRVSATKALTGFTTGQKAVTGVMLVALLVGGLMFTSWASRPSYAALYTDLEATDAAAITEKLSAGGTSYELADGGRTVMVPRSKLYDLRLELSAAGLPEGGKQGYALLDKQGITASEFRQRVDYQRALEGELTKTITAMEGVAAANVHLVIPEDDLFADDDRKPTASVLIKTRPGNRIAPGHVRSIVHLVSSSVEGLQPQDVTIADTNGVMLAAPGEEGLAAAANDGRAQQTLAFEADLALSVQRLLEPVTGPGGAVVRVKAELDFDQRSTRTERFEPIEGIEPLNEATTRETFTGTGAPVGGVLGPDAVPLTPGNGDSTYEKEQVQRVNAVSTVTEEVKAAPGAVKRMSVAVLLNDEVGAADAAAIKELVAAATLFEAERGDTLQVRSMAFDQTAADAARAELQAAEEAASRAETMALVKNIAILAILAVVALVVLWRSSRKQRRQAVPLPHQLTAGSSGMLDLDSEEELLSTAALAMSNAALSPAVAKQAEIRAEVAELVDRQPEEVAQLLRGWLADRRAS